MEQRINNKITPEPIPVQKTGHIGYVKVESYDYERSELKPRLFDVDSHEWQPVG